MALGSSRAQLFAMVLTEASALVLAGAAAGLALASGALRIFVVFAPAETPRLNEIHFGLHGWLCTAGVAAVSTLVCGCCRRGA